MNKPLAGFPPATRHADPETSHKAEAEFTALGKRAERSRQVLDCIRWHPWSTTGELARIMHKRYPQLPIASAVESPHKRVADLEAKGLVKRGAKRVCRDTGRERLTWYITEHGRRTLEAG